MMSERDAAAARHRRRVLVKVPNWAGDIIMCLPALAAIREVFPRSEGNRVDVLTEESRSDLLYGQDCCDKVLAPDWNPHHLSAGQIARFITDRRPYDVVICFTTQIRFVRGFRKARIPIRLGYGKLALYPWLTHRAPYAGPRAPFRPQDQATQYLPLAAAAAEQIAEKKMPPRRSPKLRLCPEHKRQAGAFLKKWGLEEFYIAAISTSKRLKRWPLENFVAAIKALHQERRDLKPLLLFGPDDGELYERYISDFAEAMPAGTAATEPGELRWGHVMAVVDRSSFVITGDTGPRHVAALLGSKTVSIFGPTDLNRAVYSADLESPVWVNVGCNQQECKLKKCTQGNVCITSITPDVVVESVKSFIFASGKEIRPG